MISKNTEFSVNENPIKDDFRNMIDTRMGKVNNATGGRAATGTRVLDLAGPFVEDRKIKIDSDVHVIIKNKRARQGQIDCLEINKKTYRKNRKLKNPKGLRSFLGELGDVLLHGEIVDGKTVFPGFSKTESKNRPELGRLSQEIYSSILADTMTEPESNPDMALSIVKHGNRTAQELYNAKSCLFVAMNFLARTRNGKFRKAWNTRKQYNAQMDINSRLFSTPIGEELKSALRKRKGDLGKWYGWQKELHFFNGETQQSSTPMKFICWIWVPNNLRRNPWILQHIIRNQKRPMSKSQAAALRTWESRQPAQ